VTLTQKAGTLKVPEEDGVTVQAGSMPSATSPDGCVDILQITVHGLEFDWGILTKDRESPEMHLQKFVDMTNLRIHTI
jgi:hypothetical protein